ncbi:MAG: helix-hairpin-helix domain-containing protein [Deltaproteobacteria bacterium]|nr:MAG: helix-hairpin-helix domain-containing protein [Deltaproteobacteria bacterium]
MKVREGQRVGELTVLIASLAVYGGILLHERHPLPDSPLPWGDQGSGMIAIEVTGNRGADGIYFLPETTAITELSKITGNDTLTVNAGLADTRFSSASAISVSIEEGVLKVTDMSAAKRLVLGLPIDLNRAIEEELLLVPGIGEKMAAQIVQLRGLRGKFEGLADLTAVPGIKERKLRNLEKYLTVGKVP